MTNATARTPSRRPSAWERDRAATIVGAAELARDARIDYDDGRINETRADLGQAAVMVGCADWHCDEDWHSHVSDALANIVHFCRRAGLDPALLTRSGLDSAEGDLDDGSEAERDAARFPEESEG